MLRAHFGAHFAPTWLPRYTPKMNLQDPKTAGGSTAAVYPNDLPRRTLAGMATDIQAWLDRHADLGISRRNRISRLCKIIVESTRTIMRDDPEWAEAVQSQKDIKEYWFIFHVLNEQLSDTPFLDRIKRSLDDPTLPVESGDNTHGRDTQFELLLAAVAARAGLKVEDFEGGGADWKLVAPIRRWAMEAKRIKSWSAAEKRIRRAAEQIETSGLAGVIALDVSVACNPDYQPMDKFVPDDVLHKAQRSRGEHLASNFLPSVKKWIGSAPVGFLLVYDFQIRPGGHSPSEDRPWSLMASWDRFKLLPPGSPQTDNFDELWSLFGAGLPQLSAIHGFPLSGADRLQ